MRALKGALGGSTLLTGQGTAAPYPEPLFPRQGSASLRSGRAQVRFRLTKSITSSDNLKVRRRCAPMAIVSSEIADRIQMKSLIDFVKLGIPVRYQLR